MDFKPQCRGISLDYIMRRICRGKDRQGLRSQILHHLLETMKA